MSDRISGKVKWFNNTKGYGFIVRDDNGDDVFVHREKVEKAFGKGALLAENQSLSFVIREFKGKTQAEELQDA